MTKLKSVLSLGSTELETVWIDDISVRETTLGTTDVKEDKNMVPSEFDLLPELSKSF